FNPLCKQLFGFSMFLRSKRGNSDNRVARFPVKSPLKTLFIDPANRGNHSDAVFLPISGKPLAPVVVINPHGARSIGIHGKISGTNCPKLPQFFDINAW